MTATKKTDQEIFNGRPDIERAIFNEMRPTKINKIGDDWELKGVRFKSILKKNACSTEPWSYIENDKKISFAHKQMRWDNGTVIKDGTDTSEGKVETLSIKYDNALGTGINIKIVQDNYRWQKLVEIESLESLGKIPVDAEYLEISFKIKSDFVLPNGKIIERIPFGVDSFIQSIHAWDSSQLEDEIESNAIGEINKNLIIKRIPVSWLKQAIFPIITDTTITYGTENIFNSAITIGISVAALDSTHFVVAYQDVGNNDYGTCIVGVISGTTITSYGAENVFNMGETTDTSISALDSTHFVVGYRKGIIGHGTCIVGVVSGTTISSYGADNTFNSSNTYYISISALDSTHFVVAYQDVGGADYGCCRVGVVSGTTISSYGAENTFNSAGTTYISISALDSTHFVVAYRDEGGATYGICRVGVVSGTTISSYGAENVFNSASTTYISISALDSTHFVVGYRDYGGDKYGICRVGAVSGTTISSYGAENIFNSASTHYVSVAALDSTHFVVGYKDYGGVKYGICRVGVVSGTTISSYNAENTFNSADTTYISVTALDSTHFVVAYRDEGGADYGCCRVGAILWTGKINGVTNPAKIMGVAIANIKNVMGV